MERGKEFSELVYRLLLIDKVAPVEDVAAILEMSYHSLHARLHNKTLFSAEEIRQLAQSLNSVEILDFFLDGTDLMVFERADAIDAKDSDSVFRRTNHLAIETANVLEAVETAMKDNRIDHRDTAMIKKEIAEAERALAAIRQALT